MLLSATFGPNPYVTASQHSPWMNPTIITQFSLIHANQGTKSNSNLSLPLSESLSHSVLASFEGESLDAFDNDHNKDHEIT